MAVFPGERLIDGPCPLLLTEREGQAGRTPVVFLPGALHTARIAYGLPHDRSEDFLAHWIASAGHPFVGVSYPVAVADPVFAHIDPDLRLDQMTEAIAAELALVIDRHGWSRSVIVAAWSALGNTAPRLRSALERQGVELGTFVALAATPPLPNLILGSPEASESTVGDKSHYTESGLLRHGALRSESFFAELERIDAALGRTVIERADYRNHHLGPMPLELFPGLEATRSAGGARIGHEAALEASAGARWAEYPLCASIWPTLGSDRRHALTDRFNWAMVNANAVHWRVLAHASPPPDETWADVLHRAHQLCDELHRSVPGGHFFFVGEPGARQTARAILDLDEQRQRLEADLLAVAAGPLD